MFDAIVFDLDGTLIDSRAAILDGFMHVLKNRDIKPCIPVSAVRIGPPLVEILRELSGITDNSLLQSLADDFKHYYDNGAYLETRAFEGADDLLNELRLARVPCFIATNKRITPTRLILKHLEWAAFFHDVYALDRTSPPLPNKTAMLASLLTDKSLLAENTLYIGDTLEDKAAALANNMSFAAAAWGYGDFPLVETSTFHTPHALLDYLRQ